VQPTRRPGRFDLRLEAWYRLTDEAQWRRGLTHNVSAKGAVIQTSDRGPAGEQIAVVIALPSAGCLVGRGRVVRALTAGSSVTFAVAVERFRIEHRDAAMTIATPESSDGASPRGDLRVISPPA
jgi:hypothetical protein